MTIGMAMVHIEWWVLFADNMLANVIIFGCILSKVQQCSLAVRELDLTTQHCLLLWPGWQVDWLSLQWESY